MAEKQRLPRWEIFLLSWNMEQERIFSNPSHACIKLCLFLLNSLGSSSWGWDGPCSDLIWKDAKSAKLFESLSRVHIYWNVTEVQAQIYQRRGPSRALGLSSPHSCSNSFSYDMGDLLSFAIHMGEYLSEDIYLLLSEAPSGPAV